MVDTYESVLLVKPEVFIYKIPPSGANQRHRAGNWNLAEPTWTGRMRLVAKGNNVSLKLEDKMTGALFANCPVETYPGVAIESVTDSSRYFVIRILDDNGKAFIHFFGIMRYEIVNRISLLGRCAFLGMGFGDRSDSFDLNVALQDHFKWVKNQEKIEKDKSAPKQELDLGFKEEETIKINMKITKKDGESSRTGKGRTGGSGIGLPPPPGGVSNKIAPPPGRSPLVSPAHKPSGGTEWGDFATAGGQQQQQQNTTTNSNWVQF